MTRSGPTTSAQRATSWSCRWRCQNDGESLLGSLLSIASSHVSYDARMLLWMYCCHCDGRIRASGRSVTTTWAREASRSSTIVRMASGLASAKNSLLITTRLSPACWTSLTSFFQCDRSGGLSTE